MYQPLNDSPRGFMLFFHSSAAAFTIKAILRKMIGSIFLTPSLLVE